MSISILVHNYTPLVIMKWSYYRD